MATLVLSPSADFVPGTLVSGTFTGNGASVRAIGPTVNAATLGSPNVNYPVTKRKTLTINSAQTAEVSVSYVIIAAITLDLPPDPVAGDWIEATNLSDTVLVYIGRSTELINGIAEDFLMDIKNVTFRFTYISPELGWVVQ